MKPWYFSTLSVVGVVYGLLATTIIGLLSLEIASIILLLGAQVIAEYERLENGDTAPPGELKAEATRADSGVGEKIGTVVVSEGKGGVSFKIAVTGLPKGQRGFHVHEKATCGPAMKDGKMTAGIAAGEHFDPERKSLTRAQGLPGRCCARAGVCRRATTTPSPSAT